MSDLSLVIYRASSKSCHLKHEGQRVFEVSLERRDPSGTDGTINSPVIRAEGDLHDVGHLEATLLLGGGDELGFGSTDGEDT